MAQKSQQNIKNQKNPQKLNDYARYSGMAFQMIAIIGLSVFAGVKIDAAIGLKIPLVTIILSLLGVFLAIYSVVKGLMKNK